MSWSRICSVFSVLVIIFGMVTFDDTIAGEKEKIKSTGTSVNVKFNKIDIGNEDGHAVAVYENKLLWIDEMNGEKVTGISRGTMDFNYKAGKGIVRGYSETKMPNGDTVFSSYEGKMVGKGQTKGTFTYIGGTGKYEGCTGGGTWESQSLAQGVSHIKAEGERIYP